MGNASLNRLKVKPPPWLDLPPRSSGIMMAGRCGVEHSPPHISEVISCICVESTDDTRKIDTVVPDYIGVVIRCAESS